MEMSSLMVTNIFFYALFAVAGLPANAFLIFASRHRRSSLLPVGDLLVLNLALADFLHIVFRNLSVVLPHVARECLFGALPCSAIGAAMYFTIGLSANFTLMLSLYRLGKLRHVCRPSGLVARMEGSRWPPRAAAAAWLFCCASALPYVALLERTDTASDTCVCTANPRLVRGGERLLAYNIFQQVLYEFTPVVGMILANAKIVAFLLTRRRRQVLAENGGAGARRLCRQVRAAKVLVGLVLLFMLCWGTHVLVSMFFAFDKVAVLAGRLVGMLHSVCSPYLIVIGNRGLRSRVWAALGRAGGAGGGGGGGRVRGWWWPGTVEPTRSRRRSGGDVAGGGGGGGGSSRMDVELPPMNTIGHADALQSSISFSQQLRMATL